MNLPTSENLLLYLSALSGTILFLFSIQSLGNEVQDIANENFRKKLAKWVQNRFSGALAGAISTAIVHSSTAITTITLALVNSGVISFHDSLGVIFGSGIGTTITAQIALLSDTPIAPILVILGFGMQFLGKKVKKYSNLVLYIGLILFSLGLVSSSIKILSDNHVFDTLFNYFTSPLLAFVLSFFFTVLVHSSSITTGLLVIFASTGVIPPNIAIAMVLGANMGTSISSLVVTHDYSLFAKRTGYANFFFKAIGSLLFMLFLGKYTELMGVITEDVAAQVALSHLIFNLVNTLFFLVILTPFEKFIRIVVPGDDKEVLLETKYIDNRENKEFKEGIEDIKNELVYSVDNTINIYEKSFGIYYNPTERMRLEIEKYETLNDYLDEAITKALLGLSRFKLTRKMAKESVVLVKISNTIEQLGDLGLDFGNVFRRMHKSDISPDEIPLNRLTELYDKLIELFEAIKVQIKEQDKEELKKIKGYEEEIYLIIREEYDRHVQRLQDSTNYDGNVFVDAVSIIELSVSKLRDIRKLLLGFVREFNR